jgi:hypothetical protein
MEAPFILMGSEYWNRHFSISAHIVRITQDDRIACAIGATTSDRFLEAWIVRDRG